MNLFFNACYFVFEVLSWKFCSFFEGALRLFRIGGDNRQLRFVLKVVELSFSVGYWVFGLGLFGVMALHDLYRTMFGGGTADRLSGSIGLFTVKD